MTLCVTLSASVRVSVRSYACVHVREREHIKKKRISGRTLLNSVEDAIAYLGT